MIKRLSYLLLLIFFYGCNNADGNDCFQTAGEIIQQEIEVESFKKIVIHSLFCEYLVESFHLQALQ